MGKKNKVLDGALRYIQNAAGNSNNQPPVGSVLENYKQYVSRENIPTYTRAASSLPDELNLVAVNPFYSDLGTADENKIAVKVSKRAIAAPVVEPIQAACNIEVSLPAGVVRNTGFTPAKVTVRNPGETPTSTTETSQITGIVYKKLDAPSYTFPYGQKTGELYESVVRAGILAAVQGIPGATATFTPERLR